MISILIPIYNYNCVALVKELHLQASKENIDFEIICIDDASSMCKNENREINHINKCCYIELEENIGRAKIRNLLAQKATYEFLLFMDCDSEPTSSFYIKNYIDICQQENSIICGGVKYKNENILPSQQLRYKYGKKKEEIGATIRNEHPANKFTSFNLLISKNIFNTITFNESITQYGHEDTLFGLELQSSGFKIVHIDNSLYHLGLDENHLYLKKTRQSIENALSLSRKLPRDYINSFTLLKVYYKIKRYGLSPWFRMLYRICHKTIEKHLTGNNPNITIFSIYKLMYIAYIEKEKC